MAKKKVGLITLHGMGKTKPGYSTKLINRVIERIGASAWAEVAFQEIYYQGDLQRYQDDYWDRVKDEVQMDGLRKLMIDTFSDASNLETSKSGPDSAYYTAQEEILRKLIRLWSDVEVDAPLIIIGESLGCQVISNYLWDAAKTPPETASAGVWKNLPHGVDLSDPSLNAFVRGDTTARMITVGCNIPLFLAGRPKDAIHPIKPVRSDFKWLNLYDDDDVLGWPLQQLSRGYDDLVDDIEVRIGITPLTHLGYRKNRRVVRTIAESIEKYLD